MVLDGARLISASAKQQGAELIRLEEAKRQAGYRLDGDLLTFEQRWRMHYDRITVTNTDLRDMD